MQKVIARREHRDWLNLQSGVAQGTVLDSLFFLTGNIKRQLNYGEILGYKLTDCLNPLNIVILENLQGGKNK